MAGTLQATALRARLAQHYAAVGPLLETAIGRIPLIAASYPKGFDAECVWHSAVRYFPAAVDTVQATTSGGTRRFLALHTQAMEWAVHALGAVEFHSWSPVASNPERVAFARILLEPAYAEPAQERLLQAALAAREALQKLQLDAIPILDGESGIALWIPFSDAPRYDAVRAWLHRFAALLALDHPQLITTEPNTRGAGLVHVHVSKNSPGTFTVLPYSARGNQDLTIALPVRWNELGHIRNGDVTVDSLAARIESAGETLILEQHRIGPQRFAAISGAPQHPAMAVAPAQAHEHGHVLAAAMQILADGRTRSAGEIVQEAVNRGLLPPNFDKKLVYTALIEYISRARGGGRKPYVVQDERRNFRLNEPPDDFPGSLPAPPAPDAQTQALIARVGASAIATDPAAFEVAVCDAFAHLGFATAHVGGAKAPDGYADALLGPLGYRVMVECKTAKSDVSQPDAAEASKFRDAFNAQYCVLIGPAFPNEVELTNELHTHGVSAWTVADLQTALAIAANPYELRPLFEPGYAADALTDLQWSREHGERKRLQTVADLITSAGWHLQEIAVSQGGPSAATHLTIDAAMALVDEALSLEGAHSACTREEMQLAFQYLANPLIQKAAWLDEAHTAIVIITPQPSSV